MKKLIISTLIAIIAVLAMGTQAHADDPPDGMRVEVVVGGDNAVLSVSADGDGTTVLLNGKNINDPAVFLIENNYDDSALRQRINELQTLLDSVDYTLSVTNDGLAKVILVIKEHTANLSDLLDKVNRNEEESVARDNELAQSISDLRARASDLEMRVSGLETKLSKEVQALSEEQDDTRATIMQINERMIWSGVGIGGVILVLSTLVSILFRRTRGLVR